MLISCNIPFVCTFWGWCVTKKFLLSSSNFTHGNEFFISTTFENARECIMKLIPLNLFQYIYFRANVRLIFMHILVTTIHHDPARKFITFTHCWCVRHTLTLSNKKRELFSWNVRISIFNAKKSEFKIQKSFKYSLRHY